MTRSARIRAGLARATLTAALTLSAAPSVLAGEGGTTPEVQTTVGTIPPPRAACLSDDDARKAVIDGRAQRLGTIRRQVVGDIVNARLCLHEGRLVYRVTVLTPAGEAKRMAFDARSGSFVDP